MCRVETCLQTCNQGRRKMQKVRGALRALKAQVLLKGPGTPPSQNFFYF